MLIWFPEVCGVYEEQSEEILSSAIIQSSMFFFHFFIFHIIISMYACNWEVTAKQKIDLLSFQELLYEFAAIFGELGCQMSQ